MLKDKTRDYATSAFRMYASLGKPTYDELKKRIYERALLDENIEPSKAVIKANAELENKTPLLLDVLAVEKTLEMLNKGKKEHIVKAIEQIYFTYPDEPLGKNAITSKVRRFAYEYGAVERTVFRWLKEARLLFSAIRGLRIDDDIKSCQ